MAILIVVPVTIYRVAWLPVLLNSSGVLSLLLFAIAFGFLLDILKVYQLTRNYKAKQKEFFEELAKALDVPIDEAPTYFSVVTQLSKKRGIYDLERRHSEWILTMNTAMVFCASLILWIGLLAREFIEVGVTKTWLIPCLILAISLISAVRLFYVGAGERTKSGIDYVLFATKNKEQVLNSVKVEATPQTT